jgi:DNA-binding transcriptional LysR family regulator
MLLAVPQGHPLTKRKTVRLRDLQNMPFVGFPAGSPGLLRSDDARVFTRRPAPRIVQEASDRDTNLGLVQCRIGLSWQNEAVRWHCPRGIALVPVVDMKVRMPFNLIWKKDNSSPLLQKFVAQVKAL